jgi:galactose-1-phosphate uridylyltransferase
MFSVHELKLGQNILQYRWEHLTGFKCRISPGRSLRGIEIPFFFSPESDGCPFCPENITFTTPTFPNGERIRIGESVTFPNLYPFAACHTVTAITGSHRVETFGKRQLLDAFEAQFLSLLSYDGYCTINWNYLPSSGASLAHPHLQGLGDEYPSLLPLQYITGSKNYRHRKGSNYWDDWKEHETGSERFLFGNEITWFAHAVPLGEREVRGIFPVSSLDQSEPYIEPLVDGILSIINVYRELGTYAFNMSIFFDKSGEDNGFRAFCSIISRINPNKDSLGDSSFMERLHLEPVILTLPEELGNYFRKKGLC